MTRPLVRMRALALAAAAPLLLSGCYHYVAEGTAPPVQGTPVRIRLARPASFELPSLTAHNIGTVTAEMIREEHESLIVSSLWLDAVTGQGFSGENWTLRIPRSDIADVSIRELSRWRTAVVFIGGVVATWLGFEALNGADDPAGGGGGTVPR